MAFFAVAAPISHHVEVAPNPSVGVAPVSLSNYLGGAAILGVLAVMMVAGVSAAGIQPKANKRSNLGPTNASYPVHFYKP